MISTGQSLACPRVILHKSCGLRPKSLESERQRASKTACPVRLSLGVSNRQEITRGNTRRMCSKENLTKATAIN